MRKNPYYIRSHKQREIESRTAEGASSRLLAEPPNTFPLLC